MVKNNIKKNVTVISCFDITIPTATITSAHKYEIIRTSNHIVLKNKKYMSFDIIENTTILLS